MLTPLGDTLTTTKSRVLFRCQCGKEYTIRVNDVLGGVKACPVCAGRTKMLAVPEEQRRELAMKASLAAAAKSHDKATAYITKYGAPWSNVRGRMTHALARCQYKWHRQYKDYGARGIEFRFASPADAAVWVLDNIGPPPPGKTLDRIDNNRHYEPGNLRWATRQEQNLNKRAYKRSVDGLRVRNLQAVRPDLTDQTLRVWIKKGLTDDEITTRRKHIDCGVRHSELRPAQAVLREWQTCAQL